MTRSVETSNATKLSDNPGSFENILEDNITDTLLLEIYPHQEHIDASKTILDSSFTASEAYQSIFRLITKSAETDQIYVLLTYKKQPKSAHFSKNDVVLPCVSYRGLYKNDYDSRIKINRALYFNNTEKLVTELLGNKCKVECPLSASEVYNHYFNPLNSEEQSSQCYEPDLQLTPLSYDDRASASEFDISESDIRTAISTMSKNTSSDTDNVKVNQGLRFDPKLRILTLICNMALRYEVAAAIIRLYGELCQNIPDFIDPSVESESKAAKKSVNSQYDEVLSCSAKFHNRLRQQWSKCLTQAHGVAIMTNEIAATVNDGLAELSVSIQRIPNDNDSLSGISSHHSMAYCYECEYCSTILSDNVKIVQGHYNVCARMVSAGYTIPRGEKRNANNRSLKSIIDDKDSSPQLTSIASIECVNKSYLNIGPKYLLDVDKVVSTMNLSNPSSQYGDDNLSYPDYVLNNSLDEFTNLDRCPEMYDNLSFLSAVSAFDTLDHDALFVALSNAGCPNFLLDYIRCSYDMCDTRALSIRAHSSKCKHTGENVVRDSTQARVLRSNQTESVIYDLCNDLEPNISFNVQNETTLCLPDHLICNQQSMICSPSSNTDEQCVSSDNTSQPVKTSSSRSPDPEQVQVASNELCRLLSNKDIDSPDLHECGDLLNNVSDALNAGCTRLSLTTLCFNQQHLSSAQPDKIYDINRNRLGQYNIAAIAKHLYMDGRRAHKSKSLLETLGLHAVQIQSSANDIKRSIFNSIYKNPTRTKEVRRKMIGEIKSDKAKWSQFLSINDETTIDYCRLLSDLKQKRSIHGLSLLQIAAEAYQSIFERTNSIKKAIRAVFDGNLSCKDNYVWSLSEIWRQASTQALGIDLMTSKHGPPSSMFSYSYSSKPHHIFVNL
ncbi:hypothetical protein GJ496_003491 [Pomphorhynchus laevis]|nr:hypothetical protein GJ496_003491 [Pomphorhynchus laevis]